MTLNQRPSAAGSPINRETIEELRLIIGDQGLNDVITTYVADADNLLQDLQTAVRESDVQLLFHASHTLKSSSGGVGAHTVAVLCEQIETASRDGNLDLAAIFVPLLAGELARTQEALRPFTLA